MERSVEGQGRQGVLLNTLLEAHRSLLAVPPFATFELFEALYEACRQVAPVDSFYICLYQPDDHALHFPFHFDMGSFDQPVTLQLGEGPTSRAITAGRFVEITANDRSAHEAGVPFGNMNRTSRAALHVPMHCCAGPDPAAIVGVLSVQSYEIDSYDPDVIPVLEILADRAGGLLWSWRERRATDVELIAIERECSKLQKTADLLRERYLDAMARVGKQAETLTGTLDENQPDLWRGLDRIRKTAYRAQADLSHIGLGPLPSDDEIDDLEGDEDSARTVRLTDRECEVLALLSRNQSNREIADALGISVDTVKYHCKNLYTKLGARSRQGVVRAATRFGLVSAPLPLT
jgi:DNA-binding CsgD family transcriptional regulator